MDEKDKQRALQSCHSHPTSGHFGVSKTWQRISERFYWKGLSKDVKNMVIGRLWLWAVCHRQRYGSSPWRWPQQAVLWPGENETIPLPVPDNTSTSAWKKDACYLSPWREADVLWRKWWLLTPSTSTAFAECQKWSRARSGENAPSVWDGTTRTNVWTFLKNS